MMVICLSTVWLVTLRIVLFMLIYVDKRIIYLHSTYKTKVNRQPYQEETLRVQIFVPY